MTRTSERNDLICRAVVGYRACATQPRLLSRSVGDVALEVFVQGPPAGPASASVRKSVVDREELEINLFPDYANPSQTAYNTVGSARALVGEQLAWPRSKGEARADIGRWAYEPGGGVLDASGQL